MYKIKSLDWFGIYWGFVIIFLPLFHPVNSGIMSSRDYKDGVFYLACAISLFLFEKKKIKNLEVAAFILSMILFLNWKYVSDSIAFFHMLGCFLTIGIMFQFAHYWEKSKKFICAAFLVALLAQFIWLIFHWVGLEPSRIWGTFRRPVGCPDLACEIPSPIGSLDNSMVTAAYFVPIVPFALAVGGWFVLIPSILSLFLLNSAGGWFGFAAVFGYLALWSINRKTAWLGFVAPIVVALLVPFISVYLPFLDDSTRYGAWASTIHNVGLTVFGKGAGWFFHNGRVAVDPALKFYHEHNEFLSLYVSSGIVGIVLVSYFLKEILKNHLENFAASASLLATLCVSYTAFPLHISSSALTFAVACGALMSYINKVDYSQAKF